MDILSETMRYLGETRLHVAAVYFMVRRRYYDGRLRMKLVADLEQPAPSAVANMRLGEFSLIGFCLRLFRLLFYCELNCL